MAERSLHEQFTRIEARVPDRIAATGDPVGALAWAFMLLAESVGWLEGRIHVAVSKGGSIVAEWSVGCWDLVVELDPVEMTAEWSAFDDEREREVERSGRGLGWGGASTAMQALASFCRDAEGRPRPDIDARDPLELLRRAAQAAYKDREPGNLDLRVAVLEWERERRVGRVRYRRLLRKAVSDRWRRIVAERDLRRLRG